MTYGNTTQRNSALRHIPIKVSGIYQITNQKDGKFYVGSARDVRKRLRTHLRMLRTGSHSSPHLQRAWLRDGEQAFRYDLIEEAGPENLIEREQHWLDATCCYDDTIGYNICRVVGPPPVVQFTPEMREAISARFRGIPKSEEHRRKIGDAQRGSKRDPAAVEKQRAAVTSYWSNPDARAAQSARKKGCRAHNKGVPLTDDVKRKLSESAIRRLQTPEGRAAMLEKLALMRSPEAVKKASRTRSKQLRGKSNRAIRLHSDGEIEVWKNMYQEGMTAAEIATAMNVPKHRIHYWLKNI